MTTTTTIPVGKPANATTPARSELPQPPSPQPSPKSSARFWLRMFVLLVLIVAAVWGYPRYRPYIQKLFKTAKAPTTQPNRGLPVVVAKAQRGDLPVYLTGLGTVTPLATVTVHTRVDGEIEKVAFTEGQLIKQGDPIIEIDPRPFQVLLDQAEAQMAKDQAALVDAKLDLKRYLDAGDAATQQQRDTAQATVLQDDASIKNDQAAINSAKLQLIYCHITSPITGRIGLRLVDIGNIVHAADANGVAVVTQIQPITVIFTLPEDNIPQILKRMSNGSPLVVEAYDRDLKNKLATGSLLTIDNQIDQTTASVRLKAQFPNQHNELFPNQFVNARLLLDVVPGAIIVPSAAVQRGTQTTFIYVVNDDNTVKSNDVVVGPSEADETSIVSGLSEGDVVVTDGVDKLQPGAKVIPTFAGSAGAATQGATTNAAAATNPGGKTHHRRKPAGADGTAPASATAPAAAAHREPAATSPGVNP